MEITVACYSGHRGEETPRRILIGERRVEIKEILDRWLSPDHRYFKVLSENGSVYVLRHDPERWAWELTHFNRDSA